MNELNGAVNLAVSCAMQYALAHHTPEEQLPNLIRSIHKTIVDLATGAPEPTEKVEITPAVPVKKSVTNEYIVCLDDGKKFKSLKRHLGALGMTPDQYRAKWGLPYDYPMVAPAYAATRSALAKSMGLGKKA